MKYYRLQWRGWLWECQWSATFGKNRLWVEHMNKSVPSTPAKTK
jgi:hypothetical protein